MYQAHWGMQSRPFDLGHDPAFFVPLDGMVLAQAKLRCVLAEGLGPALITGAAGVGKSELARLLLGELQAADWTAAYMVGPGGSTADFLPLAASLLGAPEAFAARAPLERLLDRLTEIARLGRRVCLMLDEVHTVRDLQILEFLRTLLNLEVHGRRVLDLVLIGQPGMEKLLEQASGLAGHAALRVELAPMDDNETKRYMLYRLKLAGCSRGIFTRHAADLVHEFSRGIPRCVNRLCELCLLTGFGLQVEKITPELVRMAAQDLGMLPAPEDVSPAPGPGEDILADLALSV